MSEGHSVSGIIFGFIWAFIWLSEVVVSILAKPP